MLNIDIIKFNKCYNSNNIINETTFSLTNKEILSFKSEFEHQQIKINKYLLDEKCDFA